MTQAQSSLAEILATGKYKIVGEKYELPLDRALILAKINEILEKGKVQRLTLKVGNPIIAERLVPIDDPKEPTVDIDIFNAARNGEVSDLALKDGNKLRVLLEAFTAVSSAGYQPFAILVNDYNELKQWLGIEGFKLSILFGTDVLQSTSMPVGSFLVTGSSTAHVDEHLYSVRVTMEKL